MPFKNEKGPTRFYPDLFAADDGSKKIRARYPWWRRNDP